MISRLMRVSAGLSQQRGGPHLCPRWPDHLQDHSPFVSIVVSGDSTRDFQKQGQILFDIKPREDKQTTDCKVGTKTKTYLEQ
jgi:hypothetical protein